MEANSCLADRGPCLEPCLEEDQTIRPSIYFRELKSTLITSGWRMRPVMAMTTLEPSFSQLLVQTAWIGKLFINWLVYLFSRINLLFYFISEWTASCVRVRCQSLKSSLWSMVPSLCLQDNMANRQSLLWPIWPTLLLQPNLLTALRRSTWMPFAWVVWKDGTAH